MASSGPNSPGTLAEDAAVGTRLWTNVANAGASDNSYATVTASGAGIYTSLYLKATNFGFAVSGTIDGITVEIERKASGNSASHYVVDNIVRLVVGGTIVGSDLKDGVTKHPTSDAYATYGGASNLWGLTPTDTEINGSTFGVVYSVSITGPGKTVVTESVDHIRITITYTAGGGGPTVKTLAALGVG